MKWKPARKIIAAGIAAALLVSAGGLAPSPTAFAAVPKLEQIRVALFLESGKLQSSVSLATVSSAAGLSAALNNRPWPADAALAQTARVTADQYALRLLETGDFSRAKMLKDQLAANNGAVSITTFLRNKKAVYQVKMDGYASKAAADAALAAFRLQPAVSVLMEAPVVQGPFRWSIGAYGTWEEADSARSALADKGLEADVALVEQQGGGLAYEVWTGAEANAEALAAYKLQVLQAQSSLNLTEADTSKPYVLKRNDATASTAGTPGASLLLFSIQGATLSITALEGELRVVEKANRTYRGSVEFSYHNGKLAVINQLPFEHYLYSVVSGEMGAGWPQEALKAQAVAARTYALQSGVKYEIAHVSDSTLDQVYSGQADEASIQAVDATAGEVLVDQNDGTLIMPFFSSNAGGMTSSGEEVWGNEVPYLKVVTSPDEVAAAGRATWHRGILADGQVVYVHSDYLQETGAKNSAGLPLYEVTDDGVNARKEPYADNTNNPPVAKLNKGDRLTVFGQAQESNAYSWTRGPYSAAELLEIINAQLTQPLDGPLVSLEIASRGESGRVTELTVNGETLEVSYPDAYRALLGGLPSTLFEIERSGGYTIQGAAGSSSTGVQGNAMYALTGSGQTQAVDTSSYFVLNGDGQFSHAAAEARYTFIGNGYGHGLGMSQWGARGWAEQGKDYREILSYYYEGTTLTKE